MKSSLKSATFPILKNKEHQLDLSQNDKNYRACFVFVTTGAVRG